MKVRRMKCCYCSSLNTIKNGKRRLISYSLSRKSSKEIQRFKCKDCNRTFITRKRLKQRYSKVFKLELTRMHVEERMSYRVITKRIKERYAIRISKNTICRMVNEVAGYSKGDIKINEEYKPRWFGYLTVDDKYFGVKADKKMILTATDSSGDLVHMEIFKYIEQQRIDEFIRFIKEHLKYPFKAITTDLDEMLEKAIRKELGTKLPHQKCLKHALDSVDKIVQLKQKRKSFQKADKFDKDDFELKEKQYKEAEMIFTLSKQMFYSSDKRQSKRILKGLRIHEEKYPKLFDFFNRHLYKLLTHQRSEYVKKTNNIAENINRQLMRRLKTIESFQKLSYAENYLNLYKNYLRFKPYTDCRKNNKFKNGKSPLEVCGVVLNNKDWLKNAVCFY